MEDPITQNNKLANNSSNAISMSYSSYNNAKGNIT